MYKVLARTVNTIFSRYFLASMLRCFVFTTFIFAMFSLLVAGIFSPYLAGYFNATSGMAVFITGIGTFVLCIFLLPFVLPFICTMHVEFLASIIESKEYQLAEPQHALNLLAELWQDCKFVAWMLFLNLLCLPLYLIPGINILVYYCLNSYLLGRDFFEIVMARHVGKQQAKVISKQQRRYTFAAGFIVLLATTIPLLNLFAPLIACVLMVHLIQQLKL